VRLPYFSSSPLLVLLVRIFWGVSCACVPTPCTLAFLSTTCTPAVLTASGGTLLSTGCGSGATAGGRITAGGLGGISLSAGSGSGAGWIGPVVWPVESPLVVQVSLVVQLVPVES